MWRLCIFVLLIVPHMGGSPTEPGTLVWGNFSCECHSNPQQFKLFMDFLLNWSYQLEFSCKTYKLLLCLAEKPLCLRPDFSPGLPTQIFQVLSCTPTCTCFHITWNKPKKNLGYRPRAMCAFICDLVWPASCFFLQWGVAGGGHQEGLGLMKYIINMLLMDRGVIGKPSGVIVVLF
jgi:hypothetical protein